MEMTEKLPSLQEQKEKGTLPNSWAEQKVAMAEEAPHSRRLRLWAQQTRPHGDVETSTSAKLASRVKDEETVHRKRRIPTTDLPKRRIPQRPPSGPLQSASYLT
jgi:hypothetical protein